MNKVLRTLMVLASYALTSALFADQSIDLGYRDANQTISIATESTWDANFAIIDNDTNEVVADASVLYNGWWYGDGNDYSYWISGGSNLSGVSVTKTGWQNVDISGLPAGNYRMESYTQWGSQSANSYTGNYGMIYTYDEAPSWYHWYYGPIIQISYFIW